MKFTEPGTILLRDIIAKSKKYNYKACKSLEIENKEIQKELDKISSVNDVEITVETSINFMILKKYEERNTRIFKNYIKYRFDNKLVETVEENEEMVKYNTVYNQYINNFPFLDFSVVEPPLNLFIRVIVLENCGAVMIDDDFIQLKEGVILFVKKNAVKHLLEKGCIKII